MAADPVPTAVIMCSEIVGRCYIIHGRCSTDGGLMQLERRSSNVHCSKLLVPTPMLALRRPNRRGETIGRESTTDGHLEDQTQPCISRLFWLMDVIIAQLCSKCALLLGTSRLRVTGLGSVCFPLPLYSSAAWIFKCSLVSTRKAVSVRIFLYKIPDSVINSNFDLTPECTLFSF